MATLPTPEEMGKKILCIFKDRGIRAEEVLKVQIIQNYVNKNVELRAEDFNSGLIWLVEKGYIQKKDMSYMLTPEGFAVM